MYVNSANLNMLATNLKFFDITTQAKQNLTWDWTWPLGFQVVAFNSGGF